MKKYVSFWWILLFANYYQSKSFLDRAQELFSKFINFCLKPKTIKYTGITVFTVIGMNKICDWTNLHYNRKINQNLSQEKIEKYVQDAIDKIKNNSQITEEEKKTQLKELFNTLSKDLKIGGRETNIEACNINQKYHQIIVNMTEFEFTPKSAPPAAPPAPPAAPPVPPAP
jgi:lysyl-tRNA synthetase class II